MLKELQVAIIERLNDPAIAGVKVIAWPRDPKQEIGRVRADGLLLVRFLRDSSSTPSTSNQAPLIQSGSASFELRLLHKSLRDDSEALPLMESIRELLSGYCPTISNSNYSLGLNGFYQRDRGFVDLIEGIWDFFMLYEIPVIYRKLPHR